EQAAAMAAFQGLVGQLLTMFEDFKAGRLAPVAEPAAPHPLTLSQLPTHAVVKNLNREGRRGTRRGREATDRAMDAASPAAPPRPSPALQERGELWPRRDFRLPAFGFPLRSL